jgi:hypothetical protein
MIWTRVFERPETMHHSRGNYELLRRLSSRAGRIEGDKSSTTSCNCDGRYVELHAL